MVLRNDKKKIKQSKKKIRYVSCIIMCKIISKLWVPLIRHLNGRTAVILDCSTGIVKWPSKIHWIFASAKKNSIIRATLCITYSQYSSQATHPPRASSVFLTMEQLTVLNYSPPPGCNARLSIYQGNLMKYWGVTLLWTTILTKGE